HHRSRDGHHLSLVTTHGARRMIKERRIVDILKMPSVDSDGGCLGGDENYNWSVQNALDTKVVSDDYHQGIKAAMERDGINTIPIHIALGKQMAIDYAMFIPSRFRRRLMMGNGHHRLKMMLELGFTH